VNAPLRDLSGWLLTSEHIVARLIRFGCVGVSSGLVYGAVTALLVSGFHAAPTPASIAGYCVSVPVSFLGHRGFSFRSHGRWTSEALRFVVTQALNLAVTVLAMRGAVAMLHVSYLWGIAATVVLVPIANFLLMNFWVFARGRQPRAIGA
jgi:putative flippase GtrA